jgi:hypothetical protein
VCDTQTRVRKEGPRDPAVEANSGGGEQSPGSFGCPFLRNEESVDVVFETDQLIDAISLVRLLRIEEW